MFGYQAFLCFSIIDLPVKYSKKELHQQMTWSRNQVICWYQKQLRIKNQNVQQATCLRSFK